MKSDTFAWLIWTIAAAMLVMVLENPWYALTILLASRLMVAAFGREESFHFPIWRASVIILLFSALYQAAFVHVGDTVLYRLPAWPLIGGPITLEAIVDGKYYWIPFTAIKRIRVEPPTDLRDVVWIPATFTWVNEGEVSALIPTRYPGSESTEDEAVRLARKTQWLEKPGELSVGLGQRMFATDAAEYSLLQIRQIELDHEEVEQEGGTDNG